ncbi:MMS19 nucleotide excision repair protein homolog isoform X2 [Telopea speciosissima]|uniref:MMS19 nucleotide excision repair protein homolog isoform X2 n=1 Tax=Telopea speciosissima TaxID=54955 RepID=UPI001CC68A5F|nr:MMS19 nucleotide excision repair protein homolog isoform X2 [Telopea speciosissima]
MAKPSSWIQHVEAFVDVSRPPNQQIVSVDAVASLLKNGLVTIETLVREMEMYLTTTDNVIRARGILLLGEVLTRLTANPLNNATVHSLIRFFTERLADWQALHGALLGCLALLKRKSNAGMVTGSDAKAVAESYLQNLQVQSLGQHDRQMCFELLECLLSGYPNDVATLGDDLVYGICEAIDGERDPKCLMLTFHLVEILAQLFPDPSGPLASYASDIFEILSSYFPIHFTHPKSDDLYVKRDDLSRALMLAFSSTPFYEPFAIPLLLEKLSSSLPSAKVDSLKYLSSSASKYGVDRMEKHSRAIWMSLKDTIFSSSSEDVLSLASESPDAMGFQENEVVKEGLVCLYHVILQNERLFTNLIVEDEDVEMIFRSVTSCRSYNGITVENRKKLQALGRIISVSAKVSSSSCSRIFQSFFIRLMDILGVSSDGSGFLSEKLNSGALYLCIELLAACKDLVLDSGEPAPESFSLEDTWCNLLQKFSAPLTDAFSSILVSSMEQGFSEDIYFAVKGLQSLATFPGFLPILKPVYENILAIFMSIITSGCEITLLWKLSLKALVQIGIFIEKYHDSEKALSYMNIVVEKFIKLIHNDDSVMSLQLKLEAATDIGSTGKDVMLRIAQGMEEAISTSFYEACVKGNLKSVEILVPVLECYSTKVLPWFHKTGEFEKVVLNFAINIWIQIESIMTFNICFREKELLDATVMAMNLAVGICSEENQSMIVQKAYDVLSLATFLPLNESVPLSAPVKLEGLQCSQDFCSFSSTDEWLISLFASVIMAVRPQTEIPNVRFILKLFMFALLRGQVPAAQALGSMINKLPVKLNSTEGSSTCTLEEAMDIIFEANLWSLSGNVPLRKCSTMDRNKVAIATLFLNSHENVNVQTQAIVGLAWIGKGLLMRGHEKVKEITMLFLGCLLSSGEIGILPLQQDSLGDFNGQDIDPVVMRSAADAFHVLLGDSEVCLNKRCHASIRPLYRQHFFSIMMPILLFSIAESDSSTSRRMLYRAFAHFISGTPVVAVVAEAKKLIAVILDALSMLSMDVLDKDLVYSLLLTLSAILTDENERDTVSENAHIIVDCLIGLASYSHMMLVRETAIQCLVALSGLPYVRIYPMRTKVLRAILKALDDPKRIVREEAVRCRQAWASIASRSIHF